MRKFSIITTSIFVLFAIGILTVFGQDTERSQLIQYVESKISTPSYQIRLNGLEGTLSSNVSLDSITIADADGIWLNIQKPTLVWTRSELLRGRLVVDQLQAEKIHFIRKPLEDTSLPAPESSGFAIPELPVSVVLEKLELPLVELGKGVNDLAAKASVNGKLVLDGGSMDLDLKIARLDGEGGSLNAISKYSKADNFLDLDIQLTEPSNGILSSTLGLKGRPPVQLNVSGKAPLADLKVNLAFDVDGQRILTGGLQLDDTEIGMQADFDLNGPVSKLLSPASKGLLGENTTLQAQMLFPEEGGFVLQNSSVNGGTLGASANAATTKDGFLRALNVDLEIADKTGSLVNLPLSDVKSAISSARIDATYDAEKNKDWISTLRIDGFSNSEISIDDITLNARGKIENFFDARNRLLSFNVSGWVDAITAQDTSLAKAIGSSIQLTANGDWQSGLPLKLRTFRANGETMHLAVQGTVSKGEFDGLIEAKAEHLEAFSALTGRDMSGSFQAQANGTIEPLSGGFDLTLSGSGKSLAMGAPMINSLLGGTTKISGRVARTSKGIAFDQFNVSNNQVTANIDGNLASEFADLRAAAAINDIRVIDKKSRGRLELDLSLNGKQSPFDLAALVRMQSGKLAGQRVKDLTLKFDGTSDRESLNGELSSDGFIAKESFDVSGKVAIDRGNIKIETLAARIGFTDIQGDLSRKVNGLIQSKITLSSSDISALAALFLTEASGRIEGNLELSPRVDRTQSITFDFAADEIRYSDISVTFARILGNGNDILTQPKIDATVSARNAFVAGVDASSIQGQIQTDGNTSLFELTSKLRQNQAAINATGKLDQSGIDTRIVLRELALSSNIADARLASPSTIIIKDQSAQLSSTRIVFGGGSVDVSGTAGQQLDIAAVASNIPLGILNALIPELGASGTVSGSIAAKGTSEKPRLAFNIEGRDVSVSEIESAGLSPIQVSTNGSFSDDLIRLDRLSLRNSQALEINGAGTLPVGGQGLDLGLRGGLPLKILEQLTVDRGTRFVGKANLNVRLSGSLQEPKTSGEIRVRNGTISDPIANLRLNNTSIDITLANSQKANLRMQANLSGGGNVRANGSLSLASGIPADINIELNSARYSDGHTFSTTVSGNLLMNGRLLNEPFLSGDLFLSKTEISVPETFSGNADLLEIEHVSPSTKTAQTLRRIDDATLRPKASTGSAPLRLDVTVNAPNQIFVRGRGLDAELGGKIRLTGTVSNLSPQGNFSLRRGRLSILSQRMDLVEGDITLEGDLDPVLNFLATTSSSDVQAFIRLSGPPSNLQVSFSSNPELPEDEVLAHIIFGRNITDLSPAQIARLASLAAELTGGKRPSLIDGLRANTGLDDIDIVQDSEGNAAVKAGKYVSDNVYLGVQAGRETEATINLDITDDLTARGAVNSRGESTLGIFFEKDY